MQNIKISTIIPLYNAEKYLRPCLDSIINQTLENIEIICINDGSTDNTLNILNEYVSKDNRVKVISTENRGIGSARNIGLKEAKGEYISFIDGDDWIELEAYDLLFSHAKKNELDMCFFQARIFMNNTKVLIENDYFGFKCLCENSLDKYSSFNYKDIINCLFNISVNAFSKIYKRSFLEKNNLIFPEGIMFEDNLFFYDACIKAKKIGFFKKNLYNRRQHDESITQNITKKVFDMVKVTNSILNLFKELNIYEIYKKQIINHVFKMLFDWFELSPVELKEEFFSIIKKDFMGYNVLIGDFEKFLKTENLHIFNLLLKSNYYLDFKSEYDLSLIKYEKVIESETKNYKISIIIPIYNGGNILHRTLMSIENQTFDLNDIEVIMVNDCSTDNSSQIIDNYAKKYTNFKSIHLKKNTGSPGTPRNVGIKEAKANYIIFFDHDDFFETDALAILYDNISKGNNDIVFGTYKKIIDGIPHAMVFNNKKKEYYKNIEENEKLIAYPAPSIWTKIFNKNTIIENNILFFNLIAGEDAIFYSKMLLKAKGIIYLEDLVVCNYEVINSSLTNTLSLKYLKDCFISEQYLLNLYKDNEKEFYFKYRCQANINFFLTQFYNAKLNDKEILNLYPLLKWFVDKSNFYGIKPDHINNKILFYFIMKDDVNSLIEFKNSLPTNFFKDADFLNYISDFLKEYEEINKLINTKFDHLNDTIFDLKEENENLKVIIEKYEKTIK